MKSIKSGNTKIHFKVKAYDALNKLIKAENYSKIVVLVDENTHVHCLPVFLPMVESHVEIDVIEIEAGEIYKSIDTVISVYEALSDLDVDRKSLLINLGGGVITDLGGFVASTFKRGIAFVNVPTSLLGMVDASIGGKTGVDLEHLKNQIGVVNTGEMVLIDTGFLNTLPDLQMRSGMAEMLKHGLIKDESYWERMSNWSELDAQSMEVLIHESIQIKQAIVDQDPLEKGPRKSLNFGHTLGHAIESYYLTYDGKESLLHGEAIAIGMVLACFISHKELGFPALKLEAVKATMHGLYGIADIDEYDYEPIVELLKFDKKNSHGNINFVLLEDIGKVKLDCTIDNALIYEAFKYYAK
ncbi:MAG: 3-dehydroquinate synthase [Bacteroidia bacterium]|nr:3-dehydroquinate synthase [Bacteroidia bacterium]NND26513.1 3-dehydroquinate synthase [Flavobacteriaceae bacterium]MBT8279500.1 3-dehydroquinate synthase [Bacteroidia bacterium]NNK59454.1 3-dehydroquinate synthase [Flavobacteriaceae bacterium]NNL32736.1 3-dehydroquinate synthase [Flavobacteriaceae bacterium]